MIIYKITNKINNKVYIGQTRSKLRDRWNSHCRNKKHSLVTRAIEKYGRDNFTIEEIDRADSIEELNIKEANWIKHYNSSDTTIGYNIMLGGDSNTTHSEETKAIISKKAREISDETRKKMSEAKKGKKLTEEHKAKIVRIGYTWSEESKEKSRQKQKGRPKSPESIAKMAEAHRGKKRNPEAVEKTAAANRGRKATPEQKERYRQAALKREAKRRERNGKS